MKTMFKMPAILLGVFLLVTGATQIAKAQVEDISLQTFYDELSPYGVWIKDPQYGYVWRPDVDQSDFRPYYSNGRWVMTEYGNTWVSDYDWGWAPFHYGRWVYNRYNQWVWIPDTVWGPAWVTWRSGGGYYGWAPLGPSITIGINFGRRGYRIPDMCWNFVPYSSIYYTHFPRYHYGRNRVYIQKTIIINNTYVRNNRTYYTGPRAEDIRRATNQNVTVYNINRSSRPGNTRIENNTVNIYNPRPERGSASVNTAPRNVIEGNINRGVISRDGNMDSRADRGRADDVYQNNRDMSSPQQRIERSGERERGQMNIPQQRMERPQQTQERNERVLPQQAPQQRMERSEERERGQMNIPQQRMERPQQAQERSERVLPQQAPQQRMQEKQQQAPQQRMERPQQQQQAPQRSERAERQAPPQRMERSSSGSQQRSSESRSRGGESGRVRGGE